MSNALMKAMAVGLPSISTDCPCGESRDLIKDEILIENNNKEELVSTIIITY